MHATHTTEIVDSHCHLDFPELASDIESVVQRAAESGVGRMVTICTSLVNLQSTVSIAESFPQVFFAAGTHPHNAEKAPALSVEDLVLTADHPKMVGIGETGLDYHYTRESAAAQKRCLAVHIEAARRTGLPLIIHTRSADSDIAEILRQEFLSGEFSCVMHCFASGKDLARSALDLGFYISMSGIATFSNADDLRNILRYVPSDRILIETDSPYLAPKPKRGKRNEPAFVVHVAKLGASLLGLPYEDFARATTSNFETLFSRARNCQIQSGHATA